MSTAEIRKRIAEPSPRLRSQFVGGYYLLTIVLGAFVLLFHGRLAFAADLIASVLYIASTIFLHELSKQPNPRTGAQDAKFHR
jgi:hypothetical protein